MEEELDLIELFNIFWRKKFVIILVVVIFGIIGAVYCFNYKVPLYKSYAKVILTQNNIAESTDTTNEITQTDITLNQQLVSTYGELIKSKNIIKQVLENLGLEIDVEEISKNVGVKSVEDTQVIEITYVNEDAEMSYKVTNELLNVFCEKVKEIYNISNVYIVDNAEMPDEPYNINHEKDILLFAAVGMVLACMVIFVISLLDTTVKSAESVERTTGLNVLGQLPEIKIEKEKK